MKRFKMPSKREFQAMYPPKDDAFDRAVRAALDALPDDGAERKPAMRKVSVILAAAVLLLTLACAAVAAGLGVFGKLAEQTASEGYSELYRALDEKSTTLDNVQNVGDADGQTFRLTQAYVDDDKLFLSYEMTGLYANADYTWQPTDEDDAKMQPIDSSMLEETEDAFLQDLIREMKQMAEQNGRASAKLVKNQCSFGAYLNETREYLEPIFWHEKINLDGSAIGMKMFELPDMYKNEKILPLAFDLFEEETFYAFDGTHWRVLRGDQKALNTVHIDVPLHPNEIEQTFEVQKTIGTTEIKLDVETSNVTVRVLTNMKSLDGHLFSGKNENWKKGDLAEWKAYIDGEEGIALSGNLNGLETTECMDEMVYIKPQIEPKKLEWIPSFYTADGDGIHVEEHPEEAVTIWLTQP